MKSLLILMIIQFHISIYSLQSIESLPDEEDKWFWNKEEYPNPIEQTPYCRRTKTSFVCDPDQVLNRKEANRLDDLIKSVKNVSICFCPYCPANERGLSVGIVLMKDIYKDYNVRDLQNAKNFAEFVRKKWNFGICENNLIIIVITSDNQVAYSEGSTTSRVLPEFLLDSTILDNKIYFIQNKFFEGLENTLKTLESILKTNIQYSDTFEENLDIKRDFEGNVEEEEPSHLGLILGLLFGLFVFITFIIFILIFMKKKFNEDGTQFQFKGMLSKGYWLNKNERLRPVSVRPMNTGGGVYEPCSIEDTNPCDNDIHRRIKEKLSQISDGSTSSDEEEIEVIDHNSDNITKSVDNSTNSKSGHSLDSEQTVPILQTSVNINTSDVNV